MKTKLYQEWNTKYWYQGVEWLTGVDMFTLMNEQEEWYPQFVPILGIQVMAQQLSNMYTDYLRKTTLYRHPTLQPWSF